MISNVSLTIGSCFSWNILSNDYGRRGDVSRGSKIKQISKFPTLSRQLPDFNEAVSTFWWNEQCLRKPLMCWKRKSLDRYSTQENDSKYVIIYVMILVSIKSSMNLEWFKSLDPPSSSSRKMQQTWRCQVSQVVIWWVCCSLQYLGLMTARCLKFFQPKLRIFWERKVTIRFDGRPMNHELGDNYRKTSRWNITLGHAM